MKKEKIIYVYESWLHSFMNDLTTLGFLCGAVWFNYKFVGDSYFLNGVILLMFLVFALNFNKQKYFITDAELKDFLRNRNNER